MNDSEDETFCSLCGHLLMQREVAARVNGEFIDYENRGEGEIRLEYCSECWAKVLAITKGGLPQARKLWREMHYEKEERKIHSILDREGVNGGKARWRARYDY